MTSRFCTLTILLFTAAWCHAASVASQHGSIVYSDDTGRKIRLTESGRDQEPAIQPGGGWVYFVRSFEGRFIGEKYVPPPGRTVPPGTLKEEIWRIRKDGTDARMLYRAETAAVSGPDPDYVIADISNIQFSPDGRKVYFEVSEWATSDGLHVMNADGSGQKLLGPGNGTRIIQDSRDPECRGYIVTCQHRYYAFGGSYDWYYLFTPDMKKEIGPLGEELEDSVAMGGLTFVPTRAEAADSPKPSR